MSGIKAELLQNIPNLRAFALSMCGDPTRADDLVQETMMKAWAAMDRFQEGTNMRAWLFTILRNVYFSELRKKKRELEDPDEKYAATLATPPEQIGKSELRDLQTALSALPDEQREAIVLVAASGLSYEEAADIAGCAIGTIKSRVNRGRAKLAELMAVRDASDVGAGAVMQTAARTA